MTDFMQLIPTTQNSKLISCVRAGIRIQLMGYNTTRKVLKEKI
jgi:hypothetical protein